MKKFNLSLIVLLALGTSSMLHAETGVNDSGVYVGLGYGAVNIGTDFFSSEIELTGDNDSDALLMQGGYVYNAYIALEGRYWNGDNNVNSWGVYVKPMYPVTPKFSVYALLGYGETTLTIVDTTADLNDEGSFQWGIGGTFKITDNFSVFADYVDMYNTDVHNSDTSLREWSVDSINMGVNYQF